MQSTMFNATMLHSDDVDPGMDFDSNGSDSDDLKPQVVILVLNCVGCIALSVLAVSLALSRRLQRRDPVVNNFLYTWILQSALSTFDELVLFSGEKLGAASETREAVLTLITLVSTLNLSIHLFFVLRSAFHESRVKSMKIRSAILVISPYIIGLIPISKLFSPQVGQFAFGSTAFAIGILTPFVDIAVLIHYVLWYDKARRAHLKNLISLSFCIRLLVFSLHRLLYIVLLFLGTIGGPETRRLLYIEVFEVVQNLFPLLAFFVIGLHFDILSLWFPCLARYRNISTHEIKRDSSFSPFNGFSSFTFPPRPSLRRSNFEYVNIDPMDPDQ